LRHEQLASAHELNAQIVLLSAEVDSLTELAASTEKTINKISNLIE
jgi:prefoldin subunit 5